MATEERIVTIAALPETTARVVIRDTVPVCISLCEPVCAESEYRIDVAIFDRPVGTLMVKGVTRFFNCREKA